MSNRSKYVNYNEFTDFPSVRESKTVIWDADSLIYFCLYSGKDEEGNKNPEYTENDIELLKSKMDEMYMKVINNIEEHYDISDILVFIKGVEKKNFRKELYPEYKSNRSPDTNLHRLLHSYFIEKYKAIPAEGAEAEDFVYSVSKSINHQGIIVYSDHDLEEIPSLGYNYQKQKWTKIDEKTARWNKYKKCIVSEAGDNVNLAPKLGIKHFEKMYNKDMTEEQYEEQLLKSYIKAWKSEELAKEKLELCKKLVWLKEL